VPQRRLPALLAALSSLADSSADAINRTIEEHSAESSPEDPPPSYVGQRRAVLDACFSNNSIETIIKELEDVAASGGSQAQWATETLAAMEARSPTSLRVALEAVRRGKHMDLADALQMEMGIATAFCVSAIILMADGTSFVLIDWCISRLCDWSEGAADCQSTGSPRMVAGDAQGDTA
jgi:3-hydroxyisobutyryl-CoA hydrolase